jgi:hypothetical protein
MPPAITPAYRAPTPASRGLLSRIALGPCKPSRPLAARWVAMAACSNSAPPRSRSHSADRAVAAPGLAVMVVLWRRPAQNFDLAIVKAEGAIDGRNLWLEHRAAARFETAGQPSYGRMASTYIGVSGGRTHGGASKCRNAGWSACRRHRANRRDVVGGCDHLVHVRGTVASLGLWVPGQHPLLRCLELYIPETCNARWPCPPLIGQALGDPSVSVGAAPRAERTSGQFLGASSRA